MATLVLGIVLFYINISFLQFRDIKWSFVVCVWCGQSGCILQIMTHFTFLFSSNKCANYPKYT